jgi:hypothetical protein
MRYKSSGRPSARQYVTMNQFKSHDRQGKPSFTPDAEQSGERPEIKLSKASQGKTCRSPQEVLFVGECDPALHCFPTSPLHERSTTLCATREFPSQPGLFRPLNTGGSLVTLTGPLFPARTAINRPLHRPTQQIVARGSIYDHVPEHHSLLKSRPSEVQCDARKLLEQFAHTPSRRRVSPHNTDSEIVGRGPSNANDICWSAEGRHQDMAHKRVPERC